MLLTIKVPSRLHGDRPTRLKQQRVTTGWDPECPAFSRAQTAMHLSALVSTRTGWRGVVPSTQRRPLVEGAGQQSPAGAPPALPSLAPWGVARPQCFHEPARPCV